VKVEAPAVSAHDTDVDPARSSSASDAQARGKRSGGELEISQVWYDEGDQLSDDARSRTGRTRKPLSASVTDVSFYDERHERPERRLTLIAVIGAFAIIGGIMAFALTRGGSSSESQPVASLPIAAPPADAAPSTIISPESTPGSTEAAATDDATKPATPAAETRAAETRATETRPAEIRPETRKAPARQAEPRAPVARVPAPPAATPSRSSEASYPVPGSEPTRRPPSLASPTTTAPPIAAHVPADPSRTPSPPSLTDSPKDPYGVDEPSGDGIAPEKKSEFFANLGAQQLMGGDTASAAANFKKASELDPRNASAVIGLGEIALRQGLWGDAIAHLSRATKLAPRNARGFTLLGESYLNSGNNTQAAAQFKKALQLDPDNARARDGYNEASSRVPPPEDDD
jgi:hypothetical protein